MYLETLSEMLKQAYQDVATRVEVKIDAQPVFVNTETAIPLGLIANEVMSNSFKHGFPGKRPGEISITLLNGKSGKYTLIIEDDGVGLPDDYRKRQSTTLGHALVKSIVSHLNGQIEMRSDKGLKTTITFTEYYECETMLL